MLKEKLQKTIKLLDRVTGTDTMLKIYGNPKSVCQILGDKGIRHFHGEKKCEKVNNTK